MPEALAIVAVFVVVVIAWVGAWMQARDPASQNPVEDLQRLRVHAAWLEQRLHVARRENWGDAMVASLTEELRVTSDQLAVAATRVPVSVSAR